MLRVCLVRNPYERMLSAYLDKLVHAHAMAIVPNGLKTNSSFAEFVYAAIDESKRKRGPDWHFSHYYPISRLKIYRPCVDPTVTRYKVEEIASWYGEFIDKLGIQTAAANGWPPHGCFYRPPHASTCADALRPPPASTSERGCGTRASAVLSHVHDVIGRKTAARDGHTRACERHGAVLHPCTGRTRYRICAH